MKYLIILLLSSAAYCAATFQKMDSYLLFEGNQLIAVKITRNKIVINSNAGVKADDVIDNNTLYHINIENKKFNISKIDESASSNWIKMNDQKERLSIRNGNLYLDDQYIEMGSIEVAEIFEAVKWGRGILCHGRTYQKRSGGGKTKLGDLFMPSIQNIEPFCVIWIDQEAHKGTSRWLYGKARRKILVFPVPSR